MGLIKASLLGSPSTKAPPNRPANVFPITCLLRALANLLDAAIPIPILPYLLLPSSSYLLLRLSLLLKGSRFSNRLQASVLVKQLKQQQNEKLLVTLYSFAFLSS